jgi:cell division protein FtsB
VKALNHERWKLSPSLVNYFLAIMVLLILLLQYRLWFGDGGIRQINVYQQRLNELKKKVDEKKQRNATLDAEIMDLKKGQEAIEERAREELGMIKENETFFQVIE